MPYREPTRCAHRPAGCAGGTRHRRHSRGGSPEDRRDRPPPVGGLITSYCTPPLRARDGRCACSAVTRLKGGLAPLENPPFQNAQKSRKQKFSRSPSWGRNTPKTDVVGLEASGTIAGGGSPRARPSSYVLQPPPRSTRITARRRPRRVDGRRNAVVAGIIPVVDPFRCIADHI